MSRHCQQGTVCAKQPNHCATLCPVSLTLETLHLNRILQAQELMRGSGGLSEEQKKYLGEMRTQLGLPQEAADRIVKEVRTEVSQHKARCIVAWPLLLLLAV